MAIVRSYVRRGDVLERVSLIWIACPSTRQFHLCSTYQHGKYNAGLCALELPRVARDSTPYGTGRQGVYPEAESPERDDLDGTLCGQNWTGSTPGWVKEQKGNIFGPKSLQKGTELRCAGTE